jgi:hypothetical protein
MLVILMATGQCDIQIVQWSSTKKGRSRPMLVDKKGNRLISRLESTGRELCNRGYKANV